MSFTTEKLIDFARSASKNAYAPYSKFAVGCVIVSKSQQVYTGCNVENASLGLTICAERTAATKGVSEEGSSFKIHRVVIYTPTEVPITPCGACRQFLHEFGEDFEVLSVCKGNQEVKLTIDKLLPKPPEIEF
jgi:cytidine deaminase